jgi:hypothetical protein
VDIQSERRLIHSAKGSAQIREWRPKCRDTVTEETSSMKNVLTKGSLWALIFVCFAAGICSAQTTLYLPQFADGTADMNNVAWGTIISITNAAVAGTAAANVTVTLTNDDGTPMNLSLIDQNSTPVTGAFQLAGRQTKYLFSPSNDRPVTPLNNGFATITASVPVTASLIFIEYAAGGGDPVSEGGVLAASPLIRQGIGIFREPETPEQVGTEPAVALANPGTGTATITFQLLDSTGIPFGAPVSRALAAKNHTAFFVSQILPGMPASFFGTMQITSDNPVAAVALLFLANGTFATIPVFPIQ